MYSFVASVAASALCLTATLHRAYKQTDNALILWATCTELIRSTARCAFYNSRNAGLKPLVCKQHARLQCGWHRLVSCKQHHDVQQSAASHASYAAAYEAAWLTLLMSECCSAAAMCHCKLPCALLNAEQRHSYRTNCFL